MAKIFIGIALVITLVTAGLAFVMKGKIAANAEEKIQARDAKIKAEGNLSVAKTELKKAQEETTAAKALADEKEKEAAAKAAQVDGLMKQVADAKSEAEKKDGELQDALAKLKAGPAKPEAMPDDPRIAEATARANKAEAELAEAKQVEETVNRKLKDNEARMLALEQYKHDRENQLQRPGVSGRILAVNPGWNFVVLNIGDRQGLMTNSPLLVTRGGEPIAKVRVTSIETSKAIADVIPGSMRDGVTVQPGDRVVYQGSRTEKLQVPTPAGAGPGAAAPASSAPATGAPLPN